MTSLACWSKLQQKTIATQTNPAHLLDHVYSSKPPQAQAHRQWWGPQQQSWNPSMNWSNLITSITRWHHQQDWSWHLHPHRSLLEEPSWVWCANRIRQTRGLSNPSKKRTNPLPSPQHRLWTLPAQVFQPFRFPTLPSVKTWVRKTWIVCFDLDSILEDDLKHNDTVSPEHMMASLEPASFPNTIAPRRCNTISKNTLTIPTTTGLQSRKRKFSNSYNSEFNVKYSVSPRNQRLGSDEVLDLSPLADSSYSSDLSDVASPRSDASSLLGEDGWEESFTELFPSLM